MHGHAQILSESEQSSIHKMAFKVCMSSFSVWHKAWLMYSRKQHEQTLNNINHDNVSSNFTELFRRV